MTTQYVPPEWAFEFHGHECPFMPIGYRMSKLALEYLGAEKEADHGFFVFPELGEGHPQTCIADCEVLLARGMGAGAYESMKQANMRPVVIDVARIDEAVQAYLAGALQDHVEQLH